jgi:hypothetical protein
MSGRLYRYRYLLLGMSVLVMFGLIASGYLTVATKMRRSQTCSACPHSSHP